ncbi:magnesium transporter CorA family protein [Dermatobacter hominis]|uniref:magnesium transporter CorA family protein n=1 Tax=Dermatobacter hominis TaxID=2884263 RepID=UPI001D115C6D|nr:CorA family divalent cation transporter [Dermatobacter hominis]UDY34781.1 hypothetical protein LH044_15735 [Dermatobacter hominis]
MSGVEITMTDDGWYHCSRNAFDPSDPRLADVFRTDMVRRLQEWMASGLRRGRTEWHDDYLLAVFVVPIMARSDVGAVDELPEVWTRQIVVLATRDAVLTIDDTPAGRPSVPPSVLDRVGAAAERRPGRLVALVMDEVATALVEIVDRFEDEAGRIEALLDEDTPHSRRGGTYLRDRIKGFRTALHEVRRAMQPTMEAVRQVVSGTDLKGEELFPADVERRLRDTLDKLMYAAESFEGVRDEAASLRDYHQARIANEQNEVMKTLTIVAALVLVPTFIVGFFGQNFEDMPGLRNGFWAAVVVMGAIVVAELVFLWWRGWIGNRGDSLVERAARAALDRASAPLRSVLSADGRDGT